MHTLEPSRIQNCVKELHSCWSYLYVRVTCDAKLPSYSVNFREWPSPNLTSTNLLIRQIGRIEEEVNLLHNPQTKARRIPDMSYGVASNTCFPWKYIKHQLTYHPIPCRAPDSWSLLLFNNSTDKNQTSYHEGDMPYCMESVLHFNESWQIFDSVLRNITVWKQQIHAMCTLERLKSFGLQNVLTRMIHLAFQTTHIEAQLMLWWLCGVLTTDNIIWVLCQ